MGHTSPVTFEAPVTATRSTLGRASASTCSQAAQSSSAERVAEDGNNVVQAAVRPAGGSWGSAVNLSVPAAPAAGAPVSSVAWLADAESDGDPLNSKDARDWAVRDYRSHLQTVLKRKPATVNNALAAVDDLYIRRGLGPANAARADLPKTAPKALSTRAAVRFLRVDVDHRRMSGLLNSGHLVSSVSGSDFRILRSTLDHISRSWRRLGFR